VILATHSMAEAEELCDRLAFIRTGQVVAQGTIAQLRQQLHYGIRCELRLRHMPPELPDTLGRRAGISEISVTREESGPRLDLTISEEGPVLAALLRDIVESGADIYSFQTRQISLEEIYLRTLNPAAAAPEPAEVAIC